MLTPIVKVCCENCDRSALFPVVSGVPFPTLCPRCEAREAREYADNNPHVADCMGSPSYPATWEDIVWTSYDDNDEGGYSLPTDMPDWRENR